MNTLVNFGNMKRVLLASDLPAQIVGLVIDQEERETQYGKSLVLTVQVQSPENMKVLESIEGSDEKKSVEKYIKGLNTEITYRIPKSLTGRGQADLLQKCLGAIGIQDTAELLSNVYQFDRMTLASGLGITLPENFTPNPRHYPVKAIEQKQLD